MRVLAFVLAAAGGACSGTVPQVTPAALVLQNGRIVTVDDTVPEAQALASAGGRIVFVGSDAEVAKYVGASTKVIDLQGQLAIPGFIEGHGHFTGIGQRRLGLDLLGTTSWDQIERMVAEAVKKAKPGQWIVGRGWHQEKWTSKPQPNVEGFPTRASLDAVSPNNPAREWARRVRQREGVGRVGHHARHAESQGRRNCEEQERRSHWVPAGERIGPRQAGRRRADSHAGRDRGAYSQRAAAGRR